MTMRSQFVRRSRQVLLCGAVVLGLTGSALAQSAASAKPASSGDADNYGYSKWDITPFFGWQWFQAFQGNNTRNYDQRFKNGWLFGERYNFDFSPKVSAEASMSLGSNRLLLRPSGAPTNAYASIKSKNLTVALDLVYHFQPRTAKTRFFILGGPAASWYFPGGGLPAVSGYPTSPNRLETRVEPGVTYGVGVKHYINNLYGIRFDVGGRVNSRAHFNLPDHPTGPNTVFIPADGQNSALTVSVGLILREGYVAPPPPPNPLVTQAMRVDLPAVPTSAPAISGAHDVCAGDDLRLTVNSNGFPNPTYSWHVGGTAASGATSSTFSVPTSGASGSRNVTVAVTPGPSEATSAPFTTSPGHTYHLTAEAPNLGNRQATYQWIVNGQPVSGATGASYDLPESGTATVSVRVTATNSAVNSSPANFNINGLTPPNLTFTAPSSVPYSSAPVALNASAAPGPCSGNINIRYSGEGVSGNTFNPGSVTGFDMSNRLRPQTKTVTLTATATDAKGQTATRTAPVTVTLDPEARRLDDVVFPNNSSRVNNCGKRLLLEELTPMLRNDPGAKVILIGHKDAKERGRDLDNARVINSAAVLSAGKGICPSLDLSRIMTKNAGADQTSTPRPALCGSSTNVKERSGQGIKESDKNAEYRRVEVWIIPSGAQTPSELSGATAVPSAAVSKVGCPR
ncbi:MAG TPA: outer membrane beta-barrel protein [Tepidisphaeraceae bacterium]|nr:outer membrane beta-barrel protein [Tepidisphaeraceae bacterium]